MATPPCPPIDKALIDFLKGLIPDRLPDMQVTEWEMGKLTGEQRVIRVLEARYNDQQKRSPTNVYQ
jgi:hypothetical protein